VAANMIGRGNARRAARRVFGVLQDRRLNQQLVLCILDEVRLYQSANDWRLYPTGLPGSVSRSLMLYVLYDRPVSVTRRSTAYPLSLRCVSGANRHPFMVMWKQRRGIYPAPMVGPTSHIMSSYNQWLASGADQPWSITNLRDAQKQSIVAILAWTLIIFVFW
jgi:hypothetical protein